MGLANRGFSSSPTEFVAGWLASHTPTTHATSATRAARGALRAPLPRHRCCSVVGVCDASQPATNSVGQIRKTPSISSIAKPPSLKPPFRDPQPNGFGRNLKLSIDAGCRKGPAKFEPNRFHMDFFPRARAKGSCLVRLPLGVWIELDHMPYHRKK